ncbi:hypothetical protein TWF696_004354 [Orbilia brochopaga]|uniref:PH domain-containing protein n=1 Tax=Orbilia brochopaga TaxID=3140254 RepID=A0AAV9V8B7_9PEZI
MHLSHHPLHPPIDNHTTNMPLFSSSSTSVNEIVSGSGTNYSRKEVRPAQNKGKDPARMRQLRRSITDYSYQVPPPSPGYLSSFPNSSLSQLDDSLPPPSYIQLDGSRISSRVKVTPRPEEGRESLPSYKCSLRKEALFDRKIEMESPFERSGDRKWNRVYCILNNTVLTVHKIKKHPTIARPDPLEEDPDDATGFMPGQLIKSFTLQHAEVGAASDYKKRSYVIRIRAETQQFLLACKTVEVFFSWLEGLSSGINMSLPLEERDLPKYQTIPRRRRRRRNHDGPSTSSANAVQQQQEIIRRHFPQLLVDDDGNDIDSTLDPNDRPGTSGGLELVDENNLSDLEDDDLPPSGAMTPVSHMSRAADSITDLSNLRISEDRGRSHYLEVIDHDGRGHSRPSTSATHDTQNPYAHRGHLAGFARNTSAHMHEQETHKWRGGTTVSREQNLRFTKRCMNVLNANTPRQTNLVIEKGIRYEIVPGQYKLVPDPKITLPSYQNHKPHIYAQAALIDM